MHEEVPSMETAMKGLFIEVKIYTEQRKRVCMGVFEEKFRGLLDGDFKKSLDKIRAAELKPSFYQVIEKEQSETVMVNTLSFFLDHKNLHKFGNQIFELLCDAIENRLKEKDNYKPFQFGELESIQKEVSHKFKDEDGKDKKGRLDMVINCSNATIGIEAKINHTVNNPFLVYNDLLKTKYSKTPIKVILCKRGTTLSSDEIDEDEKKNWIEVNWEYIVAPKAKEDDDYAPLWEGMRKTFRGEEIMNEEDMKIVADKHEDYLSMYKMIENIASELDTKA